MLTATLFAAGNTRLVQCNWAGCTDTIGTSRTALREHAEFVHGCKPIRAPGQTGQAQTLPVRCRWGACTQVIQWCGLARHLASHIGAMGGQCRLCNGSIGRSDMASRHIRACWSKMNRTVRARRLEELGLCELGPVYEQEAKRPRRS
jgi:hypothetical protein